MTSPRHAGRTRWLASIGLLGFGYVVLRPVSNNTILYVILAGIATLATAQVIRRRSLIHPMIWPVIGLQLAFAAYGVLLGFLQGAPGWSFEAIIYLAPPLIFWPCVAAADLTLLRRFFVVLAIASSILATGIVLYVAEQKGLLPPLLPQTLLDESAAGFGVSQEVSAIRFYGLSSLAAVAPMWVASVLISRPRWMPPLALRICAAVSAVMAALVGGRLAIVVVVIAAPVLLLVIRRWLRVSPSQEGNTKTGLQSVKPMLAVCALIFSLGLASISGLVSTTAVTNAMNETVTTFVLTSDPGSSSRGPILIEESSILFAGWTQSPMSGNGFGAVITDYERNAERPWEFELQYHMLLFQTGLVGALLLSLVIARSAIVVARTSRLAPSYSAMLAVSLTGTLAMLIANASNPYLHAVGHMWILYLPFAVANVALLHDRTDDVVIEEPNRPV